MKLNTPSTYPAKPLFAHSINFHSLHGVRRGEICPFQSINPQYQTKSKITMQCSTCHDTAHFGCEWCIDTVFCSQKCFVSHQIKCVLPIGGFFEEDHPIDLIRIHLLSLPTIPEIFRARWISPRVRYVIEKDDAFFEQLVYKFKGNDADSWILHLFLNRIPWPVWKKNVFRFVVSGSNRHIRHFNDDQLELDMFLNWFVRRQDFPVEFNEFDLLKIAMSENKPGVLKIFLDRYPNSQFEKPKKGLSFTAYFYDFIRPGYDSIFDIVINDKRFDKYWDWAHLKSMVESNRLNMLKETIERFPTMIESKRDVEILLRNVSDAEMIEYLKLLTHQF